LFKTQEHFHIALFIYVLGFFHHVKSNGIINLTTHMQLVQISRITGASYTNKPALYMPSSHEPGQVNFSFYMQYSLNACDYLCVTN